MDITGDKNLSGIKSLTVYEHFHNPPLHILIKAMCKNKSKSKRKVKFNVACFKVFQLAGILGLSRTAKTKVTCAQHCILYGPIVHKFVELCATSVPWNYFTDILTYFTISKTHSLKHNRNELLKFNIIILLQQ